MAARDRTPRTGVVLPSPVVLLSVVAVLLAAVAYVTTRDQGPGEREVAIPAAQEQTEEPTVDAEPEPTEQPQRRQPPPIDRAAVPVEIYNNSGITGLAADVGGSAGDAGWQVVGTDNWFGSIPSNTVYHPEGLGRAARQLALDLGIDRVTSADGAMKPDRLTVILTGPLD